MLVFAPIVRQPKESEMALSTQVQECTKQAAASLREALAFAARTEHPVLISSLTDILCRLDSLEAVDTIMDRLGKPADVNHKLM